LTHSYRIGRICVVCTLVVATGSLSWGQARYDLLLKRGHVIDPANGIDSVMDVAVSGGKIARVAPAIPAGEARKVLDVQGQYVTPGLIDLHAHVFGYSGSIFPDDSALIAGTTTVVDAGGSGWRTFDEMYERVIKPSRTRVLALINIVGHGMIGAKYEDDVTDMDETQTADTIRKHRQQIVGIKVAHFGGKGWVAIDHAIAAGKLSGTPVMIDDKIFTNAGRTTREKLLDKMRPGDIHTHMYNDRQLEVVNRFTGKLEPYMMEARRRGVLFDLGHGAGSFLWPVASKAMAQGFAPDTISTDLHSSSIMIPESDMPNCISKLMNLGMTLQDAILKSTVNPAKAIARYPEIGTLGEGQVADIAVFDLRNGVFAYKDAWHKKLIGTKKIECVVTIRGGELVYDRDGRGFPEWTKAGEYEVIQ
jgi:dihydroorotase